NQAPTASELEIAQRQLSDSFLFRMETAGGLADLTAKLAILKLPDPYYDDYRKAVRSLEASDLLAVAQRNYQPAASLIVVAGDASAVAEGLRKLAPVTIVDPENSFIGK
ncbi:MAG TPA: hypothetical protein VGP93_08040, partial [Polyangiaceae bacterium]|nr:hypothetical protein [Polyangiaceae bacterium]